MIQRNDSKGMSKESYMQAVLDGLRAVNNVDVNFAYELDANENSQPANYRHGGRERKRIFVRLLLSIDRRESTEAAMETVC